MELKKRKEKPSGHASVGLSIWKISAPIAGIRDQKNQHHGRVSMEQRTLRISVRIVENKGNNN